MLRLFFCFPQVYVLTYESILNEWFKVGSQRINNDSKYVYIIKAQLKLDFVVSKYENEI